MRRMKPTQHISPSFALCRSPRNSINAYTQYLRLQCERRVPNSQPSIETDNQGMGNNMNMQGRQEYYTSTVWEDAKYSQTHFAQRCAVPYPVGWNTIFELANRFSTSAINNGEIILSCLHATQSWVVNQGCTNFHYKYISLKEKS